MPRRIFYGSCYQRQHITFNVTTAHVVVWVGVGERLSLLGSISVHIPHMHTFETSALIMPPSYSLTSQRRQALWKSGRKWGPQFNVWRPAAARPPRSPCTSKVMDTNVPPKENLSGKGKMELPKYRQRTCRNWEKWPTNMSDMPWTRGNNSMLF